MTQKTKEETGIVTHEVIEAEKPAPRGKASEERRIVPESNLVWVNRPGVDFLVGKSVLIIGLAKSGAAAADLCIAEGAELTVHDQKSREKLGEVADRLEAMGARLVLEQYPEPAGFDYVVVSPGVRPDHPVVKEAKQAGVPVWSEMELAARCARCHLISITGTDGKSTVCTMVQAILKAHRKRTFLGGNLDIPLSAMLLHKDFVHTPHVVLESSSYQL